MLSLFIFYGNSQLHSIPYPHTWPPSPLHKCGFLAFESAESSWFFPCSGSNAHLGFDKNFILSFIVFCKRVLFSFVVGAFVLVVSSRCSFSFLFGLSFGRQDSIY